MFWYKARVRTGFRVGSPQLWQVSKKMYNPRYLQEKEDDARKATKKMGITINKVGARGTKKKK